MKKLTAGDLARTRDHGLHRWSEPQRLIHLRDDGLQWVEVGRIQPGLSRALNGEDLLVVAPAALLRRWDIVSFGCVRWPVIILAWIHTSCRPLIPCRAKQKTTNQNQKQTNCNNYRVRK